MLVVTIKLNCVAFGTPFILAPPNPQVSLQTVLGAVKRQSQEIEAKFDAKVSEKMHRGKKVQLLVF
jgi:hypothetical protein